jgi:S-disulfanyl-L-cysteine oxidoreductase SoxD
LKQKIAVMGAVLALGAWQQLTPQTTRSVWEGIYSKAQAVKGAGLYAQECASCHGTSLTGGESAPPLAGGDFLSNWEGLTIGDLFERIRTTMPATRPGALNREINAAVLAYILEMNQYPSGAADLQQQTEFLKQIALDRKKQ